MHLEFWRKNEILAKQFPSFNQVMCFITTPVPPTCEVLLHAHVQWHIFNCCSTQIIFGSLGSQHLDQATTADLCDLCEFDMIELSFSQSWKLEIQ